MGIVTEESPEHALLECPRFDLARLQLAAECAYIDKALSVRLITGDFSGVPSQCVADIRAATADFLHAVDRCLHI
jgi:hypothetical protein